MSNLHINDFELEVIQAAISGETADFRDREDPSGEDIPAVRGNVLRRLLLGLPLPTTANDASSPTVCHPVVGIRLRGARINGRVDISNSSRHDGNACPPLLLEDCVLTGDGIYDDPADRPGPALNARYARISRLCLTNCRAGFIDLTNADLLNDLELRGLQALTNDGQCRVEALGMRLHGSMLAPETRLRLKPSRTTTPDRPAEYALNLAGAEIGGNLDLRPRFTADGGVNLGGALVRGDFWGDGAHLIAQGSYALRAQSARVDGVVVLTSLHTRRAGPDEEGPRDAPPAVERFRADGAITFMVAKLGFLDMRGALLKEKPGMVGPTLNCSYAEIEYVDLSLWIDRNASQPAVAFEAEFGVQFYGATVSGAFRAFEAKFKAPVGAAGFGGSNLEVGDDLELSSAEANEVTLAGARIARKLVLERTRFSSLDARDIHVGGSISWSGSIRERGDFRGACIDGELALGESKQYPLLIIQAHDSPVMVSFEDAKVARDLKIKGVKVAFTQHPDWARVPPFLIRTTRLACYADWFLGEVLYAQEAIDAANVVAVSFLFRMPGDEISLLNGDGATIHAFNERIRLRLETSEQAADYLRFFCAHVWGDEGAFRIVESKDELASLSPAAASLYPDAAPIAIDRESLEGVWIATAFVLYEGKLFRAAFRIEPSGMVDMTDDEQLVAPPEPPVVDYAKPVRTIRSRPISRAESDAGVNAAPKQPDEVGIVPPALGLPERWSNLPGEHANDLADTVARLIEAHTTTWARDDGKKPLINLRGLSTGALDDNHGMRWGSQVLLDLDGFEYDRFEATETSAKNEFDRVRQQTPHLPRLEAVARGIARWLPWARSRWAESGARPEPVWKHRRNWLNQQYAVMPPTLENYKPQPYEQVARILRKQGDYDNAARILIEKLRLERRVSKVGLKRVGFWIFDRLFGYGIDWAHALGTFLICWILGWVAVDAANYGHLRWPTPGSPNPSTVPAWMSLRPILVVDAVSVSTAALTDDLDPVATPTAREPLTVGSDGRYVREIRCGDEIEASLYALDIFVPLLDLKQESRCTISSAQERWPWRIGKGMYAVLGWIVTSAMILTMSGIVRRQVER